MIRTSGKSNFGSIPGRAPHLPRSARDSRSRNTVDQSPRDSMENYKYREKQMTTNPLHRPRSRTGIVWCICILTPILCLFTIPATAQTTTVVPIIGTNVIGSTYKFNAGNPPPDSMGAVGPHHFVEFINSRYAVYDKNTGKLIQPSSSSDEFWEASWSGSGGHLPNPFNGAFPGSLSFDPRIFYDQREGRWYATAENSVVLLVAVSNGSDPTRG